MDSKYFNNKQYLTSEKPLLDGCELKFTFPNGYTAIVRKDAGSEGGPYGLWETSVMYNDRIVDDFYIIHTYLGWRYNPLGWQTYNDAKTFLEKIRELPERAT